MQRKHISSLVNTDHSDIETTAQQEHILQASIMKLISESILNPYREFLSSIKDSLKLSSVVAKHPERFPFVIEFMEIRQLENPIRNNWYRYVKHIRAERTEALSRLSMLIASQYPEQIPTLIDSISVLQGVFNEYIGTAAEEALGCLCVAVVARYPERIDILIDSLSKHLEHSNESVSSGVARTLGLLAAALVAHNPKPIFTFIYSLCLRLEEKEPTNIKNILYAIDCLSVRVATLSSKWVIDLIKMLNTCLDNSNENVKFGIVNTLGLLGVAGAVRHPKTTLTLIDSLNALLKDSNELVKPKIIKTLSFLGAAMGARYPEPILTLINSLSERLGDSDEHVRVEIVSTLGLLGAAVGARYPEPILTLINLLSERLGDSDERVKVETVSTLGLLGAAVATQKPETVLSLIKLLATACKEYSYSYWDNNNIESYSINRIEMTAAVEEALGRLSIAVAERDPERLLFLVSSLSESLKSEDDYIQKTRLVWVLGILGTALVALDSEHFTYYLVNILTFSLGDCWSVRGESVKALGKLVAAVAKLEIKQICLLIDSLSTIFIFNFKGPEYDGPTRSFEYEDAIASAAKILNYLLKAWLSHVAQEDTERSIVLAQPIIYLWGALLVRLADEKNCYRLTMLFELIKLIEVITSDICVRAVIRQFEHSQSLDPSFNIVHYQSSETKKILMAVIALINLKHENNLTAEHAESLLNDTRLEVLYRLSEIALYPTITCINAIIAKKTHKLKNFIKALGDKNNAGLILSFIRNNKLPITQLNFEGWCIGGNHFYTKSWIPAIVQCVRELPTLHTLNLKGAGLDQNEAAILFRLLESREAPLTVLIDESSNAKWTDAYREKTQQALQAAIEHNHNRAMLLGYGFSEEDKGSLELYRAIQTLEQDVLLLGSPPQQYQVSSNKHNVTALTNCTYIDNSLLTADLGDPVFKQLGISETEALECLLDSETLKNESIKKRMAQEITRFMVQSENHAGNEARIPLDGQTQKLLKTYDKFYALNKRSIYEINDYLSENNYNERLRKGRIIGDLTVLTSRYCDLFAHKIRLQLSCDELNASKELKRLEEKIEVLACREELISAYLEYAKCTADFHLGYESAVAYLEAMGEELSIYNPITQKLTPELPASFTEKNKTEGQTIYFLQGRYGYQRLWLQDLEVKNQARKKHAEDLEKINNSIETILEKIVDLFTIKNETNLVAFKKAYDDKKKALNTLHVYHLKAHGSFNKDKGTVSETKCSLNEALIRIKSKNYCEQKDRFSALKQALLDFLELDRDEQRFVKSIVASSGFIAFAKQLLAISIGVHEGAQSSNQRYDNKVEFDKAFNNYIESRYIATQAIRSEMFKADAINPLKQREKIMHCVGEFVLSALVAVPAFGSLAHASKATLHSLHVMAEVAHCYEGVASTAELGEAIFGEVVGEGVAKAADKLSGLKETELGKKVSTGVAKAANKMSGYLLGHKPSTKKMIANLQQSFASSSDFYEKKDAARELLYYRFKKQLCHIQKREEITLCGEAIAGHILNAMMLGLVKKNAQGRDLSKEVFMEVLYLWISYVDMEHSPKVHYRGKHSNPIQLNTLLRQSGMMCYAKKPQQDAEPEQIRIVKFIWQDFDAKPGTAYEKYAPHEVFPYSARPDHVKNRVAGEAEVVQLNALYHKKNISIASSADVENRVEVGNGTLNVCWDISNDQLNKLRDELPGDDWQFEVIPCKTLSERERLDKLEKEMKVIEIRVSNLEREMALLKARTCVLEKKDRMNQKKIRASALKMECLKKALQRNSASMTKVIEQLNLLYKLVENPAQDKKQCKDKIKQLQEELRQIEAEKIALLNEKEQVNVGAVANDSDSGVDFSDFNIMFDQDDVLQNVSCDEDAETLPCFAQYPQGSNVVQFFPDSNKLEAQSDCDAAARSASSDSLHEPRAHTP